MLKNVGVCKYIEAFKVLKNYILGVKITTRKKLCNRSNDIYRYANSQSRLQGDNQGNVAGGKGLDV